MPHPFPGYTIGVGIRRDHHDCSSESGAGAAASGCAGHCQRDLLSDLASILLSTFQLDRFIPPVTALIVGIHFFPLARLFHVPVYFLTGALLSVLALVALVALPLGLPIAGPSPYNWSLFVGVGTTLVLWLTLLSITRFGLRVMRQKA
jgi:hypothetical protein